MRTLKIKRVIAIAILLIRKRPENQIIYIAGTADAWPTASLQIRQSGRFRRLSEKTLNDYADGLFILRRFTEDRDFHAWAGTPPRIPVYQISPRCESRKISSR